MLCPSKAENAVSKDLLISETISSFPDIVMSEEIFSGVRTSSSADNEQAINRGNAGARTN